MGKIGFLGLVIVCGAAVVVALIFTGPRAAYWAAVFGIGQPQSEVRVGSTTEKGPRFRRVPQGGRIMVGGELTEKISATAAMNFDADRSQVVLLVRETGASPDAAVRGLRKKRERLQNEIAAAGYEGVSYNEAELATTRLDPDRRAGEELHEASTKLTATFQENVDFIDLLSRPEFAEIGAIEETAYWLSDIGGAISRVETRAADSARNQIRDNLGDRQFTVLHVDFSSPVHKRETKLRSRRVRLSVTATVHYKVQAPVKVTNF